MAKTKTPKPPKVPKPPKQADKRPEAVPVEYDLFALPTAFHKAGLAGLVLLIDSLKQRNKLKADDAKYEMTPTTLAVTFTEPLVRALFDDVYDAVIEEVAVAKKWDAPIVRQPTAEEKEAGKPFVHHLLQPKGAFFDNVFDGDRRPWLKFWRNMIWEVLRPRDKNRLPYQERHAGSPCNEGVKAWDDLCKLLKKRGEGGFHTSGLSGALYPGMQDENAERVPVEGVADQKLLLHFWPLVCPQFVPNVIEADGSSDFAGYTLAVPEVADLPEFVREYPLYLASLGPRVRGYRPAEAVVDLAAEGGLAVLTRMAEVTGQTVEDKKLRYCVSGIEYLHLVKIGNNIKSLASGRVSPNPDLLSRYRTLVCPKLGVDPVFRNPLFRRGLLFALLYDKLWYEPFGKLFAAFDVDVFLRPLHRSDDAGSKAPPLFAVDAAAKLRHQHRSHTAKSVRLSAMPEQPLPKRPIELLVDQVVRSFLLGKAKAKCNIAKKTKLKELSKEDQKRVFEKKRGVAEEAFLAVRSRRDQDFVKYFTEVICSAGTYFDRKSDDYLGFATALNDPLKTDSIKALTLLSLSANS